MSYEVWGEPDDPPELPGGWWDEDSVLEAQECIDRAAKFYDDVLPQIGNLAIQDYKNMNELGILLKQLRRDKDENNE